MLKQFVLLMIAISFIGTVHPQKIVDKNMSKRTRVIVTSDGEIDDECSMMRFLL
jgi:hypothetical protein